MSLAVAGGAAYLVLSAKGWKAGSAGLNSGLGADSLAVGETGAAQSTVSTLLTLETEAWRGTWCARLERKVFGTSDSGDATTASIVPGAGFLRGVLRERKFLGKGM